MLYSKFLLKSTATDTTPFHSLVGINRYRPCLRSEFGNVELTNTTTATTIAEPDTLQINRLRTVNLDFLMHPGTSDDMVMSAQELHERQLFETDKKNPAS